MSRILIIITAAIVILASGCGPAKERVIRVGSKPFTESYVVANIMALTLKKHGYTIRERFGVGSMIARMGLITGQIDIYPEYTGTAWTLYLHHDELVTDPEELYDLVKREDLEKNSLVWMLRTPVNNTYAMAVKEKDVGRFGGTLSELTDYVNSHPGKVSFGIDHEFYQRPDGFRAMVDTYGMNLPESQINTMEIGLTFEAIHRGQIDVAMVYSTDGKLKKFNLVVLKDDRKFFPIYNLCPVSREDVVQRYPELGEILAPPFRHLDNKTIQELNYRVDVLGKPSKLVAEEYLEGLGL